MRTKNKKFIRSFTGLRGLALLAVTLYHLFPDIFVGGYLGVVIFFAMSGYLLMRNYINENSFNGIDFLKRRIIKLLPPLIGMVSIITIIVALLGLENLPWIRESALSSIFGINNWVQIHKGFSYFTSHGAIAPFTHLWALSVEMQFYVIWAIIAHGKRTNKKTMYMAFAFIVISIVSGILMAVLYNPEVDPTRIYYGTDTRIFSFTIGGIFGLLGTQGLGNQSHKDRDLYATALILIIILCMAFLKEGRLLYYGGMFIFTIVTGLFLMLISRDDNAIANFFHGKVLQFLGKYSYSFYLWQYSLMIIFREIFAHSTLSYGWQVFIQIILLIIIGLLSAFFLELNKKPQKLTAIFAGILGIILIISFATQESTSVTEVEEAIEKARREKQVRMAQQRQAEEAAIKAEERETSEDTEEETDYRPTDEVAASVEQVNARYPEYALSNEDLETLQNVSGKMIGDSLTEGTEPEYAKLMPNIIYDGKVSRQMYQAIGMVQEAANGMSNPETPIIIQLGTNSNFSQDTLDEIIKGSGNQTLIFINTVVPDPWESAVNEKLAKAAQKEERIYLVDFYSVAKTQSDLFYDDNTHLREPGQRLLAQMLGRTILDVDRNDLKNTKNTKN